MLATVIRDPVETCSVHINIQILFYRVCRTSNSGTEYATEYKNTARAMLMFIVLQYACVKFRLTLVKFILYFHDVDIQRFTNLPKTLQLVKKTKSLIKICQYVVLTSTHINVPLR